MHEIRCIGCSCMREGQIWGLNTDSNPEKAVGDSAENDQKYQL